MPWQAPDVGVIDARGYMFCVACAERLEKTGHPVAGDQHFSVDDKCDRCGKQFEHVPMSGYVKV